MLFIHPKFTVASNTPWQQSSQLGHPTRKRLTTAIPTSTVPEDPVRLIPSTEYHHNITSLWSTLCLAEKNGHSYNCNIFKTNGSITLNFSTMKTCSSTNSKI